MADKNNKEDYSIIKDRHLYPGKYIDKNVSICNPIEKYFLIISEEQFNNEAPKSSFGVERITNEEDEVIYLQNLLGEYVWLNLTELPKSKLPIIVPKNKVEDNIERVIDDLKSAKGFLANL